jgi:hypothetical protein
MFMKFLTIFMFSSISLNQGNSQQILNDIDVFMKSNKLDNTLLRKIMEGGSVEGKFSSDEI